MNYCFTFTFYLHVLSIFTQEGASLWIGEHYIARFYLLLSLVLLYTVCFCSAETNFLFGVMFRQQILKPLVNRPFSFRLVSHFEILGVESSATDAQIKQAFRKKALQLHPDLREQHKLSVEEARRRFIQVRDAYEVLADPLKKAKYLESLRKPKQAYKHTYEDYHNSASGPMEDYNARHGYYDDENVDTHGFSHKRKRGQRISDGSAYSTWQSLADELDDALRKVRDGPDHMPLDNQGFPEHMETEELKSIDSMYRDAVCMYVTFGSRVLGHVVYVPALHPYDMPHDLQNADASDESRLETLSLYWNNQLHTSACRSKTFMDDVSVKFYRHTHPSPAEEQKQHVSNKQSSSNLSAYLYKPSADKGEVLKYIQDSTEHFVMRKYFPGVEYVYIYNTMGRFLEYHCSRAVLPMLSIWPIPPRDERYDAGGWHVQANKGGKYSRKYRHIRPEKDSEGGFIGGDDGGIEGSIPLLICAFSSVDRMKKTKSSWWR